MKKLKILTPFILISSLIFGQTTDIKTPLGNTVPDTYYRGELLDDTQKEALSDSITLYYPNATELNPPSATTHYNCHSYAWHRSEGGTENVWIGLNYSTAEDVYWNDGSFIEISTLSDASKISYAGNHSAIKVSGTTCKSKWGPWGLVQHNISYGPAIYLMASTRKYYAHFKVDGPKVVCDGNTAIFTTPDYINCTYTWTWNTALLDTVSGQGTKTFVVEPKTSNSQGEAWVKLELTIDLSPDVTREITKTIWVGEPDPDDFHIEALDNYGTPIGSNNSFEVCPDNYYTFYLYPVYNLPASHHRYGITETTFYFDFDYEIVDEGYGWAYVYVDDISGSSTGLVDVDACTYESEFLVFDVDEGYCGYYMMITPNPATAETTISIEPKSSAATFDETAGWELEVYSETWDLKEKKTKLKTKGYKVKTSDWKEGVYFVNAKYKDEILQGKLVVKK